MVRKRIQTWFLCAVILLFGSNNLLADEQCSLQLLVPMQDCNPCSQCSNLSHSSSRYAVPSNYRTHVRGSSFPAARHHAVPAHPYKGNYTQSAPLSLGYTAASAYILPSSKSKRYAPPSGTSGGSAGKALATWIETNGSDAWLYTNEGVKYYDMSILEQLFNNMGGINDMPGLTWDEFLQWFNNNNQTQYKAPVGDGMAVMFLLLFGYILRDYHKKRLSHHNQSV